MPRLPSGGGVGGCARCKSPPTRNAMGLGAPVGACPERCDWRAKPVAFRPPPSRWRRNPGPADMSFPDLLPEIGARMPDLRGRLAANAMLADITWFRVGGPAQVLFTPADAADLAYFLGRLPTHHPVMVIGLGSN